MRRLYSALLCLSFLTTACARSPSDGVTDRYYVHPYGVTVPRFHWEETGRNGQVVSTLKEGITCTQSFYCGSLEGETSYTFPFSDQIEKVQIFSQDQLKQETFYYPSGRLKSQTIFNPSEHNITSEWYENGQLKSYEKYAGNLLAYAEYYDPSGARLSLVKDGNGSRMQRDNYGLIVSMDTYKGGEVEYRSTYYPNGSLKDVTPYKNGRVEGLRKTYYPGGEPNTIETWVGGSQNGITTIFVDGQKSQEIFYQGGVKHGVGKIYQDGTFVIQEQTWRNDRLHGPCYTTIDGRKTTDWYYKGNKVTKGYYDSFTQVTPIDNQ